MDQKQDFELNSRRSQAYQIVKYMLLILNIMIVTTTAMVTIIVCLIPNIIHEKRLVIENAISFFQTGNLSIEPDHGGQFQLRSPLSELEIVRLVRYAILGLSALILINQSIAAYGLFRERSCPILASTTFIGVIGQLSLYVLPASVFLIILLYLMFSISYVILLNHLQAKQPPRASSRASSIEPTYRGCCCRCKGCVCTTTTAATTFQQSLMPATINPSRKTSIQSNSNTPYYYGSLGRRGRDTRMILNQLEQANKEIYSVPRQRIANTATTLRPSNKFSNLNADSNSANVYAAGGGVRRGSIGYNYVPFERAKDSIIM